MALLKSSRVVPGTASQRQQLVARTAPTAAKRGSSVIRQFRKGDDERMRELATLPEQPFTQKYPPPGGDLADIIPNPGSPRAYNIPDRFHPEEDGAEPRTRQTVLQQHVEFFDYDKDGVIWPWDTARGFRDIGYNPLISGLAPLFIHTGMSLPTQEGFPNLLLPIYIKNIHKCKHGSDSQVYDMEGRYVPQKFEEMLSKYDKDNKGGLTFKEVMEMCDEQAELFDWFGWIASRLEWTVTYAGFKDENGVLPRDAIRKQFNGSLFYEYAAKMGKSMKEKKGHGKHLQ